MVKTKTTVRIADRLPIPASEGDTATEIRPTAFISILHQGTPGEMPEPPACFADLNLDQIVDAITAGKEEYNLKSFFYASLTTVDAVDYRHEIFRDLETDALLEKIASFAKEMRAMREHLAQAGKLGYRFQKESWFLDAAEIFCEAVSTLAHDLPIFELKSRGLRAFRDYVGHYTKSPGFAALVAEIEKVKAGLAAIKYCMLIKSNGAKVRKFDAETDYSAEVLETFEKFKQGAVQDHRVKFNDGVDMNHVEAAVLDMVAKLYPDEFSSLDRFFAGNSAYLDSTIGAFDREIQFYLAVLNYIARFKRSGLQFCYPEVSDTDKDIHDLEGFDLALAGKLMAESKSVVCNDFHLKGRERIFVVSGPNQGGKTTFARTFGQLHYLASLGCPVPGGKAKLFLFDRLFTHFEKEEDLQNLHGKLEDELTRIHEILNHATPNSIVIMNEIFTSTTLKDAIFLGKKVLKRIMDLDLLCVCVTFIDELSHLSGKTVSVSSTVVPQNPAERTFKIVRKRADGLAYAVSIAEKYRLTYAMVKRRVVS